MFRCHDLGLARFPSIISAAVIIFVEGYAKLHERLLRHKHDTIHHIPLVRIASKVRTRLSLRVVVCFLGHMLSLILIAGLHVYPMHVRDLGPACCIALS
ncbi:hypothetical protein F5Y07DRAFT_257780 [Xylaria sp. FL0933]|nr:hypothetical protein F5Y07DRAFT_257780 [Xylaria sp. FL0933]